MSKSFKIIITALCVCLFIQCKSNAQEITKESLKNSTPEQRAKFITDTLTTVLKLSNDQKPKVYAINLGIAEKVSVIMKSDDGKMSKFKQIKSLQDERSSQLQKVLTSDQYTLYQEKVNELTKKMREKYQQKQNN